MLNLNQIYTAKSSATTAIRKAISRNQCAEGDYEARKVDGGFQIFATNETETPTSHEQQPGHETWSEPATRKTLLKIPAHLPTMLMNICQKHNLNPRPPTPRRKFPKLPSPPKSPTGNWPYLKRLLVQKVLKIKQ